MAFDWKKVVRSVAPTVGNALGGPLGKAALAGLSSALLGKPDAPESEIEKALAGGASFEQAAKLKELDQTFQKQMADVGVELAKLEVSDRDSARKREIATKDWVPATLAVTVHVAFFGLLWAMLSKSLPDANKSAFDILLGMLGTGIASVWSYYFGSSVGSKVKSATIDKALNG